MREANLTVEADDISRELRRRCDACGGVVPIHRAAVSMARNHVRRFCSDRCGDNDRNARAYRRRTEPVPSPLKWAGSKRWAVARLRKIYRYHRNARLVEPFAGAANVALGLRPERAHLADMNPASIAFFRALAGGLVIPDDIAVDRSRETYERNRARLNERLAAGIHDDTTGCLFYVTLRGAFNGLWRTNRSGQMNTAWGGEGEPFARDLRGFARVMSRWTFEHADFRDVLDAVDASDFVFADPPYDGTFDGYAAAGFSWRDQVALAERLAALAVPVVAMNAATARIMDLYRSHGFRVRRVRAPRRISGDGDRTGTLEVIATKNTSAFDDVSDAA
jgi:DNA adenine methylase